MKFTFDREWILAMVELQGDTPDPSSSRPIECEGPTPPTSRGTTGGAASGAAMQAAPGSPAGGASARGSRRSGYGGGSMNC